MIWQVQVDLACLIMWLWLSNAAAVISEPADFEGGPHYVDRSLWVSKSTRAATRQILRQCNWQQHSCLIGTTVCLSGCGMQQYWWFGYTGLTWSQLWPMAFMSHWFVLSTVARYPLLCVNVITALRVIWHLSAACSSDYSIVEINIVVCNFKVALSLLQPARCSSILICGVIARHQGNWKSNWRAVQDLIFSGFLQSQINGVPTRTTRCWLALRAAKWCYGISGLVVDLEET